MRILILDGHGSHITDDFIAHVMQNNIMLLRLPSHSSHLLQPLDIALFRPLKTRVAQMLKPIIRAEVSRVQKVE